jgi:GlcNAc-P-P-Und epimerase
MPSAKTGRRAKGYDNKGGKLATCVIFGGSGFIGTHLTLHLLSTRRFEKIHIADLRPSPLDHLGVTSSIVDVREEIRDALLPTQPTWIFNLAAIHREPGHGYREYFDTNIAGARNVTSYAAATACSNVFFTSSISVYGPTSGPTSETSCIAPTSPYGSSKLAAELIHECWQTEKPGRRLVICRPGVIYGPGDPGNIMRMVRAIQRGYFALPGSPKLCKSYGYVYGLLDSIDFWMSQTVPSIRYNYVEYPTESLGSLAAATKSFLASRAPVFSVPMEILLPLAIVAQALLGDRSPIHPVRVRKAATSTHIVPKVLIDYGFHFDYPFPRSLEHWRNIAPEDFAKR